MKTLIYGVCAVSLAALSAGCAYSDRTYAVTSDGTYAVATPGAEYYGDRYYSGYYYYPSRTAYVRYY